MESEMQEWWVKKDTSQLENSDEILFSDVEKQVFDAIEATLKWTLSKKLSIEELTEEDGTKIPFVISANDVEKEIKKLTWSTEQ